MQFKNQADMFRWIWDNRPHFSEISGKPLLPQGNSKWHFQFMHILAKGIYPKWKCNPENIMLGLPEEHERQDTFPIYTEKKQELTRLYYQTYYGKQF